MSLEPCHTLGVYFCQSECVGSVCGEKELAEHAHAGAYLQYGSALVGVESGCDTPGHAQVGKEMLPEGFLGFYSGHRLAFFNAQKYAFFRNL